MSRIGRYEILDELGRGAMGVVYRARDTQIGRIVALKIILTKAGPPAEVEHYKQRFQREAQAAGRLSHPGIVTLHDIAQDAQGQPYIVMEFIEGQPLNHLFGAPGQFDLPRLLDIGIQVSEALDYAHHAGVIHRDIKPENIMITREGRAKITDFGIAKLAGAELTQEGMSLGTPSYMSPEQIRGSAIDARADIFSLGAVLYWMCTGQKPFAGESVTTITFQVVFQDPAGAMTVNPNLPPDLDRILTRCLAKNPAERYSSCADLAADLESLRDGRPLASERPAAPSPVEQTAELPARPPVAPSRHGDTTLPLDAPAEQARPVATNPAAAVASFPTTPILPPRSGSRRLWLITAAAVSLAASIVAALWLHEQSPANPPGPSAAIPAPLVIPPQPSASVSDAPSEDSSVPPVQPASRPAAAARSPLATTTLRVVCKHNFRSATLEVFVDNVLFLRAPLQGKEERHIVKHYEGRFEDKRPIPAGHHTIRVRVYSFRGSYDDQDSVSGEFPETQPRTLFIEFGTGSGLGVTGRNLDLTLR